LSRSVIIKGSITFGMGNLNCNDCCWLLVAGNLQTRLLKKSEVILVFKGAVSNS